MTYHGRTLRNRAARFLLVGLRSLPVLALLTGSSNGQAGSKPARELIESLIPALGSQTAAVTFVSCGVTEELKGRWSATRELASLGKTALPDIEGALDSIEKRDADSMFFPAAAWIFIAYARIEGAKAMPRLGRMIRNPALAALIPSLDNAAALSLGLTSYVSSGRARGEPLICRRHEPRDPLNQLILAVEQDDFPRVESSLGPAARAALGALLHEKSWSALRAGIWRAPKSAEVSMGYLFDVSGRWSEAEETSEQDRGYGDAPLMARSFRLKAFFKDANGAACGTQEVEFLKLGDPRRGPSYVVDDRNLAGLLSRIASCATP